MAADHQSERREGRLSRTGKDADAEIDHRGGAGYTAAALICSGLRALYKFG
jgi:hypothetical protein